MVLLVSPVMLVVREVLHRPVVVMVVVVRDLASRMLLLVVVPVVVVAVGLIFMRPKMVLLVAY
jgi:hypothetical protein